MPKKETNQERFQHMSRTDMGLFLGELAQLFLPDDCAVCVTRHSCNRAPYGSHCADVYTDWLEHGDPKHYPALCNMSTHFLSRFFGMYFGKPIAAAGYCDDCPARRVCRNYDTPANGCAEGFERWLRAEYNKEDWPI